ncbi:mechanosensitive ion channel family protein [Chondrinema litorale]|uniref:mechanosensitive ion channel family protein n=1 Tax=Chondrinema litorale TaxID=2994555 RepID=UPI002543DED2|nr:mechanosensitive ion channel domain-containing protein [Chondrinema litorale]UZR94451.1 mechanosensitive ion channel [Chondrinema litorale]
MSFFTQLKQQFFAMAPSVILGIFLLIAGWLLAVVIKNLVEKFLKAAGLNKLVQINPFDSYYEKSGIQTLPSHWLAKLVYWILILATILVVSESFGWHILSEMLVMSLVTYLPRIFTGVLFFIIGLYLLTFVKDFIRAATSSLGLSAGKLISNIVFYFLLIIVALTSLEQAGIDTAILKSNFTIILAAILFSASVSYAFASRDIMTNILSSFFSRNTFKVGQKIVIDDLEGEIIEITNISVILNTVDGKVVFPVKELVNKTVRIKEHQ